MDLKLGKAWQIFDEHGVIRLLKKGMTYAIRESHRSWSEFRYETMATRIMEEDWDNLIILDACRYDQFERLNTIPGRLESRISLGSGTPEFLRRNFHGSKYHDTVYVTANPIYRTVGLDGVFHRVVDVWQTHWDEEKQCVLPQDMANAAVDAFRRYEDKRLIIHFIQPHYPFVGEQAEAIGEHAGGEKSYQEALGEETTRDAPGIWHLLETGEVDEEDVWNAYDENLEIVISEVTGLLDKLEGKTVISSDHGNLVKERIHPFGPVRYGHPNGMYAANLRKVPWLVLENGERRTTVADDNREASGVESDIVSERLSQLGYKES